MVGALVVDDVLRDAEAVLGGELLQRGLPVEGGAERRGGLDERVEELVHEHRGDLDAAGEVDGADQRLDGVGEDRGLVATAGALLAATELDVLAEPDAAADLGERPGVDHGGAQLGQPALGQVGVLGVERLGDDDTEDRVTEELEPLVGGQSAVLVGERPVRQGTVEQPGVQNGIPERGTQLGVVRQGLGLTLEGELRGPDDGPSGRRTGRTRRTRGAAGAWLRRRGSRR